MTVTTKLLLFGLSLLFMTSAIAGDEGSANDWVDWSIQAKCTINAVPERTVTVQMDVMYHTQGFIFARQKKDRCLKLGATEGVYGQAELCYGLYHNGRDFVLSGYLKFRPQNSPELLEAPEKKIKMELWDLTKNVLILEIKDKAGNLVISCSTFPIR